MEFQDDLLAFLNEVIEMRAINRSDSIKDLPEMTDVRDRIINFQDSIKDEDIQKILYEFENLKNEQEALYIHYIYRLALNDGFYILRLIFKTF